jgi:DNA-binding transcriptional ArsR family regulator
MSEMAGPPTRRAAAIALLRDLRRLDDGIGVKHSGIARDVALLLYETGDSGMSVNQISARTGYSGPTVRLVLDRLTEAKAIAPAGRYGKTQFYRLTPRGNSGCDAYVAAVFSFAEAQSGAEATSAVLSRPAAPAPAPDRPAGLRRPPGPHAGARPAPPAGE